jgi:hypothetical protein
MDPKFRQGYYVGYIFATILYILAMLFLTLVFPNQCHADCNNTECMIAVEAIQQDVPVRVAIAVAKVESGLRQSAKGPFGEIGVFQIRPEYTTANIHDLKTNVKEGVRQLAYWHKNCPVREGVSWVNCYNAGMKHPKYPLLRPYVKKVILAMKFNKYE